MRIASLICTFVYSWLTYKRWCMWVYIYIYMYSICRAIRHEHTIKPSPFRLRFDREFRTISSWFRLYVDGNHRRCLYMYQIIWSIGEPETFCAQFRSHFSSFFFFYLVDRLIDVLGSHFNDFACAWSYIQVHRYLNRSQALPDQSQYRCEEKDSMNKKDTETKASYILIESIQSFWRSSWGPQSSFFAYKFCTRYHDAICVKNLKKKTTTN